MCEYNAINIKEIKLYFLSWYSTFMYSQKGVLKRVFIIQAGRRTYILDNGFE